MLLKKNSLNFFSVEEDDFSEFNLDSGNNQEEEEKSNTAAGYSASTGNYGSGGSSVGDLFSGTNSQSSTSDVKTEESNSNVGNIGNKVGYQAVEKPSFSEQTRYYEAPGNKAGDIKFKGSIASGQVDAIDIEEGRFASDASYQTKTFGAGEGNQGYKVPLEDRAPISGNGEVGNTIGSVAQSETSSASKPNVTTEPATSLDAPSANNEEEHFMAEDVPEEAQGNNESTSEDDGLGYEPFDDETQDSGSTPEAASSQKKNSGGGGGGGGYGAPLQAPPPSNPWDTSNYVFDEASYNPDAVDSVPAEQLYATYSNFCKLQFISEGTVGSLGKIVNIGPNKVSNVSTTEMSKTKRCLQNIGDTMNDISDRMGNVVNQTFKFDRDAKSLFRHEGMDIPDDYADFLKQDAQNYILGLLGIDSSTFAQDLTAGEGDPSAPQIDWKGLSESDPEGCAQKASDIAAEALKKDPSEWTADDVIALQIYHADLVDKVAGAKTAYDEAAIADLYGYESADEFSDYVQLSNENKNLEKVLKANGLMEYTGWEKGWQELKTAGSALWGEVKDVAGAVKEGDWSTALVEAADLTEKAKATGAMVVESWECGGLKFVENLVDGLVNWETTKVTSVTDLIDRATGSHISDKIWDTASNIIAYDAVGELREWYHEDTEMGRSMNDKSLIKYDGYASQMIQDAGEETTKLAVEVGASILTGGTAGPIVAGIIGGLNDMGEEAEIQYSATDAEGNYIGRDSNGRLKTYIAGAKGFVEGYSVGTSAQALMNTFTAVKAAGGAQKFLFKGAEQTLNSIRTFSVKDIPTVLKVAGSKTLHNPGMYLAAGAKTVDFVGNGVISGEDVSNWDWGDYGKSLLVIGGTTYASNIAGVYAGGRTNMKLDEADMYLNQKASNGKTNLQNLQERYPDVYGDCNTARAIAAKNVQRTAENLEISDQFFVGPRQFEGFEGYDAAARMGQHGYYNGAGLPGGENTYNEFKLMANGDAQIAYLLSGDHDVITQAAQAGKTLVVVGTDKAFDLGEILQYEIDDFIALGGTYLVP